MKKLFKVFIVFIIITGIVMVLFFNFRKLHESENEHFYNEYKDVSNVRKENLYSRLTEEEMINFLKTGTGVVYFGYPKCPWCQNLVPILDNAARLNKIDKIYYIDDFYSMRPDKNRNPKHQKEYNEIVEILGSDLVEMKNENSEYNIIRVPLVVMVKNGKIVESHLGTLDGHDLKEKNKNGKKEYYLEPLTERQQRELLRILNEKLKKIHKNECTGTSC